MENNNDIITGSPVTIPATTGASPSLLCNEVDKRIVKMRPTATPLDQITRLSQARHSGAMTVEYYSIDMMNGTGALGADFAGASSAVPVTFEVDDEKFLAESDTVMFPSCRDADGFPLVIYVTKADGVRVTGRTARSFKAPGGGSKIPAMAAGAKVVRMGRAAAELDVQTSQYAVVPVKENNNCQIFKAQIEESILHRLSNKEVEWSFTDQEESAILDMRMCMERSFLFGQKGSVLRDANSEVMLTGGIWQQTGHVYEYDPAAFDDDKLIEMMREAFSGHNGSARKVLMAGSGLIETLSKLKYQRNLSAGEHTTVWGIDFNKIVSSFGQLYVVRSEVFDLCGMENAGFIIDPEYITKYTHIPFQAERISFHKQGVRNTEGVVLTEASCLVLRFPNAHMRIMPRSAAV